MRCVVRNPRFAVCDEFLAPNSMHRIAAVSPAAGDHVRSSIAGFFLQRGRDAADEGR